MFQVLWRERYFETLCERIVDIFVIYLYIYVNISCRIWLLDMEKYRDVTVNNFNFIIITLFNFIYPYQYCLLFIIYFNYLIIML